MATTTPKKPKSALRLIPPLILLTIGIVLCFIIDFGELGDRFAGMDYKPTPEMAQFKDDIELTGKAEIIFNASHPELRDRVSFNEACASYNVDVSVLGCYADGKIYVYNVNHPELIGIEQSTLAHEFLHAVWSRLGQAEQDRLTPLIQAVYAANKTSLDKRLKNYPASKHIDELHSIIGTEIAYFPSNIQCIKAPCPQDSDYLQAHYNKYFANRTKILDYYSSYAARLEDLRAEADALLGQIDALRDEIDTKSVAYQSDALALNSRIASFKSCAEAGCYTTSAFNAERRAIIKEQDRLTALFEEINKKIENYNKLIDQYNSNVAHTNILTSAMNSNSPTDPL